MVLAVARSAKLVDAHGASFPADVTQTAPSAVDRPDDCVSV
jgi:hypothetical protein